MNLIYGLSDQTTKWDEFRFNARYGCRSGFSIDHVGFSVGYIVVFGQFGSKASDISGRIYREDNTAGAARPAHQFSLGEAPTNFLHHLLDGDVRIDGYGI